MNTKFLKLALVALTIFTISCSKDTEEEIVIPAILTQKVSDLYAPQTGGQGQPVGGAFTKFSFAENAIVTHDNWDIAFRGTTIIVNGGTKIGITDEPERTGTAAISILSSTFDGVVAIPVATTFAQDAATVYAIPTGSGNGWYNYNASNNIISPLAGKVFVVKTHNGKYAKFEILSYYQNAPATPDPAIAVSRYYTFNFAYQANSVTSF